MILGYCLFRFLVLKGFVCRLNSLKLFGVFLNWYLFINLKEFVCMAIL